MKRQLLVLLCVCLPFIIWAQNLVPNPGFEEYNYCPDTLAQIGAVKHWVSIKNTPDYFNECMPAKFFPDLKGASIPRNGRGYQKPKSEKGYAGIYIKTRLWGADSNYREHLGVKLTNPLQTGRRYKITFYATLANNADKKSIMASNNIGIRFNYGEQIDEIPNFAHANNSEILNDTLNWIRLEYNYVATEAFTHLVIGNFYADHKTKILLYSGISQAAYYYIEDVSVEAVTSYAVFPNPAETYFNIKDEGAVYYKDRIEIIDATGRIISSKEIIFENSIANIDVQNLAAGIYFIRHPDKPNTKITKLVIY